MSRARSQRVRYIALTSDSQFNVSICLGLLKKRKKVKAPTSGSKEQVDSSPKEKPATEKVVESAAVTPVVSVAAAATAAVGA